MLLIEGRVSCVRYAGKQHTFEGCVFDATDDFEDSDLCVVLDRLVFVSVGPLYNFVIQNAFQCLRW